MYIRIRGQPSCSETLMHTGRGYLGTLGRYLVSTRATVDFGQTLIYPSPVP